MSGRKDLPTPKAANFAERLREEVMRLMGKQGDTLDQAMTMRQMLLLGFAQLKQGTSGQIEPKSGSSNGDSGGERAPDLTPPPQPDGFTATGAISHVLIEHAAPTYTQGGGHLRTRVYGVQYTGGPLPIFAQAVEVGQFSGTVWGLASNPGTTWRLWIKWETADGVLSPTPAGGTNGLAVTTGQDVSAMVKAMTGSGNPFTILTQPTTIGGVTYAAGTYSVQSFILDAQITTAKIANLAVDNSKIANLSVAKLTAGSLAVGQHIQSTGYVAGSAGWRINADGTAELSNAVVRGTVFATNGQFSGTIFGGAATGYANGIGFFSGETTGYRWRVGNPTGARIQWTGTAIEVYNASNVLTLSSGGVDWSAISGRPSDADLLNTGANLIANPDLKNGSFGDGVSAPGWLIHFNVGAFFYRGVLVNAGNGAPHDPMQPMFYANSTGADGAVAWESQDFIPVNPSTNYTVSAWLRRYSGNPAAYLGVAAYNANKQFIDYRYPVGLAALDATSLPAIFTRMSGVFGPGHTNFPAGTAFVRVLWWGTYLGIGATLATRFCFNEGTVPAKSIVPLDATLVGQHNRITQSNASTYIANAAIGAAQIGSLALVGTNNFSVKSGTAGARMEMDSRAIKVFDANGVRRVQIGDLTV
jgi:hypothetical protein